MHVLIDFEKVVRYCAPEGARTAVEGHYPSRKLCISRELRDECPPFEVLKNTFCPVLNGDLMGGDFGANLNPLSGFVFFAGELHGILLNVNFDVSFVYFRDSSSVINKKTSFTSLQIMFLINVIK